MSLDSILIVALDVAFFAVFGLTLVVYVPLARGEDAIAAMHAWLSRAGAPA
jgi:hypothetical protein